MLIYILLGIIFFLLILLYNYLPQKKYFVTICLILGVLGSIAYISHIKELPSNNGIATEQVARERDLELFTAWWSSYQKNVNALDRNWQLYHNIILDVQNGDINLEKTYDRLKDLEEESYALNKRIKDTVPPLDLSDYPYSILASIYQKTTEYIDKQHIAITLTRNVANPTAMPNDDVNEKLRLIELVMIRESPVGLFIVDEVVKIRNYFSN